MLVNANENEMTQIEAAEQASEQPNVGRDFVLAGKAIFTVESKTGERYTYRVTHKPGDARWAPAWFVSLLTGPDNTSSYTYLGMLDAETGVVKLTAKSTYRDDSKPVKVICWAFAIVWANAEFPEGYTMHHVGRCGRCGRILTVPESITRGIGPECATQLDH